MKAKTGEVMMKRIKYHYKCSVEGSRAQWAIHHAQNHSLCPVSLLGKLACHDSLLITPTTVPSLLVSASERVHLKKKWGKK